MVYSDDTGNRQLLGRRKKKQLVKDVTPDKVCLPTSASDSEGEKQFENQHNREIYALIYIYVYRSRAL